MIEVLIPLAFFAATFGVLYVYFTTRNKERLSMIEKGADPSIFAMPKQRLSIKLGLLAIGAAIGLLVAQLLINYAGMGEDVATISMIFLFAGISLVVEHFLAKREEDKKQ